VFEFASGSILNDFLFTINLHDYHQDFLFDNKVVNPSPSRKVLELMRLINALDPTQELNDYILKLVFSEKSFQKAKDEYYIDYVSKQKIIDLCKDIYETIAYKYLNRNFLFEKDLKPYEFSTNLKLHPKDIEIFFAILKVNNEKLLQNLYEKTLNNDVKSENFVYAKNLIIPALIKVLAKEDSLFNPQKLKEEKYFSDLIKNITQYKNFDSADMLREVAFAFEKSGDFQTACKVMEQAHLLRPKGPIIKQKLEEYKLILNKAILQEDSGEL